MKKSLSQEECVCKPFWYVLFTNRNNRFRYPFIHMLQLTKPLTFQSLNRYLSLAKPPRIYTVEGQMES